MGDGDGDEELGQFVQRVAHEATFERAEGGERSGGLIWGEMATACNIPSQCTASSIRMTLSSVPLHYSLASIRIRRMAGSKFAKSSEAVFHTTTKFTLKYL